MARKLGLNRAGTGKIDTTSTNENTEKWAGAVAGQLTTKEKVRDISVKTVPVTYIKADEDNPRKLAINIELLTKISEKLPASDKIKTESNNEWIESYVTTVVNEFELTGKQIGDFQSIVEFAASLKSASRLLHPIVVWRDESTFHLIAGERRLLAHILLNETHISAKIENVKPERHDIDTLQWEENIHREDMTLYEKVTRVRKLIEATIGMDKISVTKLANKIGRSRAEAQRYLAVLRYPSNIIIDAIELGKITDLKRAASLAQLSQQDIESSLSGAKPKPKQNQVIKISRAANKDVMKQIIQAAAKQLNAESELDDLDLNKTKDLNVAFNQLAHWLEQN
jgi:ParB/RepB/Spo0J family partition protein